MEAVFAFKAIFAIMKAIFAFMDAIVALLDRPIRFTQPKKNRIYNTDRKSQT